MIQQQAPIDEKPCVPRNIRNVLPSTVLPRPFVLVVMPSQLELCVLGTIQRVIAVLSNASALLFALGRLVGNSA